MLGAISSQEAKLKGGGTVLVFSVVAPIDITSDRAQPPTSSTSTWMTLPNPHLPGMAKFRISVSGVVTV